MEKYWLIIKNTYSEYAAYRLNFILWRVRVIIRFLITFFLWSAVIPAGSQLFGYTRQYMLSYVILVYIVSNFVFATRTQDIGSEINTGNLTNYLLKPLGYFSFLASRDISDKLLNFGFTVGEIFIIFIILKPPFFYQTNFFFLFLSLIAFILAIVIYFLISIILGFIGFWSTEVWATRFVFMILLDFLAGNYFPLDILPKIIFNILYLTPFPYIYYFPVKVYLGNLGSFDLLKGFIVLVIWLLLLKESVLYLWRKGLKVYTAEGR